jgi:flagellar hook assembly protein FlgD
MVGRLVRTIAEGTMAPGNYEFTWDGTDHDGAAVASGVYLYRLNANSYSSTKKMVLMK